MDSPAQVQALDSMGKKQPTLPVNIVDVIQKAEIVCMSYREYEFIESQKHISLEYSAKC